MGRSLATSCALVSIRVTVTTWLVAQWLARCVCGVDFESIAHDCLPAGSNCVPICSGVGNELARNTKIVEVQIVNSTITRTSQAHGDVIVVRKSSFVVDCGAVDKQGD